MEPAREPAREPALRVGTRAGLGSLTAAATGHSAVRFRRRSTRMSGRHGSDGASGGHDATAGNAGSSW
ncbi:hypothetical protein ACLKA6_008281 [Drosophila palustris]